MNRRLTAVLFLIAASFAAAQNTATFTAPAGAVNAYLTTPDHFFQWYSNLVEKSTPPYPNPVQPYNHFEPAAPNQPYPVPGWGSWDGFVSPDGLYTASFQNGSTIGILRTSAGQAIEIANPVWTVPASYPNLGDSVTFAMDAAVTAICNQECSNASGTFHMEGQFAFQWWSYVTRNGRVGGSTTHIVKRWTNTSPVVITINDQSTVAILD